MQSIIAEKPAHVPEHLVIDFDFRSPPGVEEDVHKAWCVLHNGPPVVWTPHHGGHWIVTRADLIERVQKESDLFAHGQGISVPQGVKPVRYLPLEADPPEHTNYRKIMNPAVAPSRLRYLREEAREVAIGLIEQLKPRGECEFISDFSQIMPITIFLRLVNLPLAERDTFLEWVDTAIHGETLEERTSIFARIGQYLAEVIAERRTAPGNDLLSDIATAKIDGKPVSDNEALGMALNVFIGGLDTLMNMMGFFMLHLAQRPDQRRTLIEKPEMIPNAVEELVRRYSITCTCRTTTRETQLGPVTLLKGDIVMATPVLHGLDDTRFTDPMTVDFNRPDRRHASFGNGVHRCMGAGLARVELAVLVEEWLRRIPDFQIKPGARLTYTSGPTLGVTAVPLTWPV